MAYTQEEVNPNKNKILISKTLAIATMALLLVDTMDTFVAQGGYGFYP
jgi:hypothetical protein